LTLGSLNACRTTKPAFVIALTDPISTLDPIGSKVVDAASERVRVLLFNSLVKKNEKFDYVPDLATEFVRSDDGLSVTFTLHDGVKFHDGRPLTSADVKYTFDTLLASDSGKAASFFEGSGSAKKPFISGVDTPDPKTVIFHLSKPWLSLYSNLVPIGIVPRDSAKSQAEKPVGSGPFKFVSFDRAQNVLDLVANQDYWEGAPQISALRVRVIPDANTLQAELRTGRVTLSPLATNLSPDAFKSLGEDPSLKVDQFPGANIIYLGFNTQSPPIDNVKVRQAIAYAIDRESLIKNLLLGQAKIAHSIIPEESWAYVPGTRYEFNPTKAKQLLDEAGFKDPDGNGPKMRFANPIVFKISGSGNATRQYASVIQEDLKRVGINVSIEALETNSLFDQLKNGLFQLSTARWVGGNQDPIFYRDLFASSEIPTQDHPGRNRSRYVNKELDALLEEAVNTADREKAKQLYAKIQDIVSRDLPMLPLWYPANMVVSTKNVGNIKIDGGGDWNFVKNLTITK
jgi:peptide/nickel transport system substrate-binding protein